MENNNNILKLELDVRHQRIERYLQQLTKNVHRYTYNEAAEITQKILDDLIRIGDIQNQLYEMDHQNNSSRH